MNTSDSAFAGFEAPFVHLAPDAAARPVHLVRPATLDAFAAGLPDAARAFVAALGFAGRAGQLAPLPTADGHLDAVAYGIGEAEGVAATGGLAGALPAGTWQFAEGTLGPAGLTPGDAVLGFLLGADRVRAPGAEPAEEARLVPPPGGAPALAEARAIRFGRALVNAPANRLGPAELAAEAAALASRFGAAFQTVDGEALARDYPAIHAVGAGSARAPVMAALSWQGSTAAADAPLVSLVGKGVCFDSGGYDLKPSAGMLRMKKDMGGAAVTLALAALLMRRDAPIRLELRLGCVENSVSGHAMRPGDVIATRKGLAVEINNTDAEGRLVLADLLDAAASAAPDLLLDVATLTGAARVALGPDLPALFTSDDALAAELIAAGQAVGDPMWRLPLWAPYDDWLRPTGPASLSNVSAKPQAGAITAALFLRRFVPASVRWAHLDAYCWNDQTGPARPEGGEVPTVRAVYRLITNMCETGTNRLSLPR